MFGSRPFRPVLDRRSLLKAASGAGLLLSVTAMRNAAYAQAPSPISFKTNPFTLGIASGDPAADGFVIWTRLAPEPLHPRGGMFVTPVEVKWEIAADPGMREVVQSGVAIARLETAHSVHVEISGLASEHNYFYRFFAGGAESAIGRARTFPADGAKVAQLRFGVAGCQQWEGGFYTAWRGIAAENFDFVFHYGDYIYENAFVSIDRSGRALPRTLPKNFATCFTLPEYRLRYSLYKSDLDLQAAHASCPFLPSFDDHEVMDNWAADIDERNSPPEAFLFRRQAAFQAWYEHMPVRRAQLPRGPDILAYRRLRFGELADLSILDTRQYRSSHACDDGFKNCPEAAGDNRTMMGAEQEQWLATGLQSSTATWQVLAQQVLFSPFDWRSFPWVAASDVPMANLDAWDGATAARDRVMQALQQAKVKNAVVLTGDAHFDLALELKQDWRNPTSACVGVEFLATSISSGGDGTAMMANDARLHADNPHLKFFGNQRGYNRHTVTNGRWQADYRVAEQISVPGAAISTVKSLVTEAGNPGLQAA